jgi:hypothetical protein
MLLTEFALRVYLGSTGDYIGPFGKLRAGSSARKVRGPQDDGALVVMTALFSRQTSLLFLGARFRGN